MLEVTLVRFEHNLNPTTLKSMNCRDSQAINAELTMVEAAMAEAAVFASRYGMPSKKLIEKSLSYEIKIAEIENPVVVKRQEIPFSALCRHKQLLVEKLAIQTKQFA